MSTPSSSLIHYIYKMAGAYRNDKRSDAELLSCYAETQDEHAFGALMVRHGPTVWSMCSKILRNTQDVEEAYQTVFLALAQKATKIRVTETLIGWLYKVAHRTALNARRSTQSRQRLQQSLKAISRTETVSSDTAQTDVCQELHSEIVKLPEKLRVALVLHYFEGKRQADVAAILGIKESAVRDRLNRGTALLEKRLTHQGLIIGAAGVGPLLQEMVSHAALPVGLIAKTVQTAMAFRNGNLTGGLAKLAQEVLKQVPSPAPWWKTSSMIAIMSIAGLGLGAGGIAWKTGFFGTQPNWPPAALNHQLTQQPDKEKPKEPRGDRYGDPLPPEALARLGTTRLRVLKGGNFSLLFTPNSQGLIICNSNAAARLCDAATGRVLREFGTHVHVAAISQDGRILASRSPDEEGGLCLWEIATGKVLQQIRAGAMDWGVRLVLSPDQRTVASGGLHAALRAWDVVSGKLLWENKTLSDLCQYISYSADGKRLIVGGGIIANNNGNNKDDRQGIYILNALTGAELHCLGREKDRHILACACTPDARLAAITYKPVELGRHPQDLSTILYKEVAETSLWNVTTGKQLCQIAAKKTLPSEGLAFSPDAKLLATSDCTAIFPYREAFIRLWDVGAGKERGCLRSFDGAIHSLAFSPDGKLLASKSANEIKIWDVALTKEITPRFDGHQSEVTSIAFNTDGQEVASVGADGACHVWNAATGVRQAAWELSRDKLLPLIIMPSVSADASVDATVELTFGKERQPIFTIVVSRRTETERHEVVRIPVAGVFMGRLSLSPDGEILAHSSHEGENVVLWDLTAKKMLCEFPGNLTAFSSSAKILATRGEGGSRSLSVWNIHTHKELWSIGSEKSHKRMMENGMAFSRDGDMLATVGGGKIWLWRVDTRGESKMRVSATRSIEAFGAASRWHQNDRPLAISPNGWLLASADDANRIHVWETATGKERCHFDGHIGQILSLQFAPDGRRLASGSCDTTILIWDVTGRLEQGKLRLAIPPQRNMDSIWAEMGGDDVARAGRAVWTLVAMGEPAVAFLSKCLQPVRDVPLSQNQLDQLVFDLWSNDFQVHMRAFDALAKLGEQGEPTLQKALSDKPSKSLRRRLEALLATIEGRKKMPSAEEVRNFRAIEALEQIGTPAAEALLQHLAAGMQKAGQTQAAQGAVVRLKRRNGR